MRPQKHVSQWIAGCLLLVLFVSACAATPPPADTIVPANTPDQTEYTDPFAYCAAVDTIDTPDARYTGPAAPDAIIESLREKAGISEDAPPIGSQPARSGAAWAATSMAASWAPTCPAPKRPTPAPIRRRRCRASAKRTRMQESFLLPSPAAPRSTHGVAREARHSRRADCHNPIRRVTWPISGTNSTSNALALQFHQ